MARPFIPWVGGKEKLQYIIRPVFPAGPVRYVEHFGGSGAILLGLPRLRGRMEVYNDYDSDLVNLFLCVRDRLLALLRELNFFPLHSEEEFQLLLRYLNRETACPDFTEEELAVAKACLSGEQYEQVRKILEDRAQLWDVRRAAAFYTVDRRSFNSLRGTFALRPTSFRNFMRLITEASARLEDVVITNRDCVHSIRTHDGPGTLHYCDPPYVEAEGMYGPDFGEADHRRLHDALRECRGYVVVSYNDCGGIRELYDDFYILHFERRNHMSQQSGSIYEELLITNYDPRPMLEANVKQFNMFEAEDPEQGELVLVHEPRRPLLVPGSIQS